MGNSDPPIKEILTIVDQIKKEIPSGRFFEFGDNPEILKSIEKHLGKIHHSLRALNNHYSLLSMKESNLYYQTMKCVHDAQKFIERIQNKEANKGNTQELHDHINGLENCVRLLSTDIDAVGNSENTTDDMSQPAQSIHQSPQAKKPNLALERKQISTTVALNNQGTEEKQKRSQRLFFAFKTIIAAPKPLGRFVFDLFGRHDSADSSSTIMGWLLVLIAILIILGFVPLNALITKLSEWWRFFFPVK